MTTTAARRSPDLRIAARNRWFERPQGSLDPTQTYKALMVWGPHAVGGAELGAERLSKEKAHGLGPHAVGGAQPRAERL